MLPYDYRNALIISLAAMTICLSYVVITGFIGQVSLMQVALAGASGFVVSHLVQGRRHRLPARRPIAGVVAATVLGFVAGASALRVRGVSLAVVTLAAAVAIEQFGFANSTWGAGATGSPVPELKLAGIDLGPRASFRGLDGNVPSPMLGFVVLAAVIALGLLVANLRRSGLGPADARRALQRARRGGRRHQRAQHEVRRLRDLVVHRRAWAGRSTATRWARSAPSASGSSSRSGSSPSPTSAASRWSRAPSSAACIATSGLIPHIFEAELGISGHVDAARRPASR